MRENAKARIKLQKRVYQLLQDKPPKWPQDAPEPSGGPDLPDVDSDALAIIVQRQGIDSGRACQFDEAEFWVMVRRLAAFQTRQGLGDETFTSLYPLLGCSQSWRVLKLLASEKEMNLVRWYGRLKQVCGFLEAGGINWEAQAKSLATTGQGQRAECQELILEFERWRKERDLSVYAFCRQFRRFTGDPATWLRLQRGQWHLLNLKRRLPLLRALHQLLSALPTNPPTLPTPPPTSA